jgi:hypothetical protein
VQEVLFETCEGGMAIGHTKEFFEVCVPTARALHGELLPVRVESIQQSRLCGQLERY